MGLFKSLKGNHPDELGGPSSEYEGRDQTTSRTDQKHTYVPPNTQTFAPPPGPPPSHQSTYPTPPVPPPGRPEYAPPPGPPPSHQANVEHPAPYHDWTSIPDTALLPPPPSLGYETSPLSNSSLSDADRAHEWCRSHPLLAPGYPPPALLSSVRNGDVRLLRPQEYDGDLVMPSTGNWRGSTRSGSKDACLSTSSPLYFARSGSQIESGTTKVIYFEVKIHSLGRGRGTDECSIAIGYAAMPYPTWRMPGWERGSLAVHGDDGRRYVNDTWGGKDFVSPFRAGDTVGIGMTFSMPDAPPDYGAPPSTCSPSKVEVFVTRNGKKEAGWDLHEEIDASNDLGVDGLDGTDDLYGAIGIFGGVEFEATFNARDWLWQPR